MILLDVFGSESVAAAVFNRLKGSESSGRVAKSSRVFRWNSRRH